MLANEAADKIRSLNPQVIAAMNDFTQERFQTQGGRRGSGMGLLLEGLWGYEMSHLLESDGVEIAWIADDAYNDYACVESNALWDPETKAGELFRIEAKSMNLGAVEAKGHFAELSSVIGENDLLLILLWQWAPIENSPRVYAKISDVYLEKARPLAEFRDHLHLARGGTFVDPNACPDGCDPLVCAHGGEPLNASGKRERVTGPVSCKPSGVQAASNFGGLIRMVKGKGAARQVRAQYLSDQEEARKYMEFLSAAGVTV